MIGFFQKLFVHDFLLKLFSLALAILIWLTISFAIRKDAPSVPTFVPRPLQQATFTLPVMILSSAEEPRLSKVDPNEVEVTVEGDPKLIKNLQKSELRAIVDLNGIESAQSLVKRIEISKPSGIAEVRVSPRDVKVTIPPKS